MKVTLTDVARSVGLSAATVSRAISAPERVNAVTRQRVLEAAHELGYAHPGNTRPAAAAGGPLGLIVPDIVNPFFPPIIKAVQSRAAARGRTILIADIDEHPHDELRRAEELSDQVDGLIVVSARTPEDKLDRLLALQPLVLVNRSNPAVASVLIDERAGISEAVEHLAALGHRKICYLNGPRRSWSNGQRQQAVRSAAKDAGLELVEFGPFEPQIQAGVRAADLVVASSATAVIAYDDMIALGVMTRMNERGMKVGEQLSVIGVDDSLMSGMAYPSLTSIHVPGAEAGMTAVDLLIDLIETKSDPAASERSTSTLDTRLVVRASTAAPPAV
ncbi:LacI family DNA-binding transcriptional regulator [Microbacterium sp. KRD172]|uniref:LacI family DNA-binding transcriptional regulator n=1 Tax=Microbacterium sp. KRD172 TaxID=2729727 RepID=UPI0019D01E16|nr:LacI family DNA-binding transcriptional regulator [Microbacterium sp. KRD172]